jgi:hypothetical protein
MRDLDSRAQSLMKSIDEKANEYLLALSNPKETMPDDLRREKLKTIQDLFNKAKEYGDDKVQLAIQTYELVDKHIRRLDSDLARFEGEIQDKTVVTQEKVEEPTGKSNYSSGIQSGLDLMTIFPFSEGRKKIKDTKNLGKKKRARQGSNIKVVNSKT